jgi:hypothetical protein
MKISTRSTKIFLVGMAVTSCLSLTASFYGEAQGCQPVYTPGKFFAFLGMPPVCRCGPYAEPTCGCVWIGG